MAYNTDPRVYTLATAVAESADVKAKLWSRILEVGANTEDDFKEMEGAAGSKKPFWKKRETAADAGDTIVFSTIGEAAGPGVRGEAELTGSTSVPRMGTYSVQVDFWRDAVEVTKKQMKFLATGKSLESVLLGMLSKKLGRKRMWDMMISLIKKASGNILRPNGRTTRDAIRHTDTLTPAFLVTAKARLQGLGARPTDMSKSKSGSPVLHYLAFIGQDAMTNIRNSSSYQNALSNAAARSNSDNPLFSGKLVDWQGLFLWEHIVVNPDADDVLGSPIAPYGILGTEIAANGTGVIDITFGSASTARHYASFFPGYDWIWVEGQAADTDSTDYYLWVVNASGAAIGKACFYKYTGSSNNGNKITIKDENGDSAGAGGRIGSTTSAKRSTQVGNVTWDANTMTNAAQPVGSYIIPANKYGVPIGYSFVFGAGAALRAEGSLTANKIEEKRDYGFIHGMGYEGIWGQGPTKDTQGATRNYVLLQHAIEYPGITVPYVTT